MELDVQGNRNPKLQRGFSDVCGEAEAETESWLDISCLKAGLYLNLPLLYVSLPLCQLLVHFT